MRIALGVEYDGAPFCGWQTQPEGCGVQDYLEKALAQLTQHEVQIVAAGRTDTGVHALSQVVHFDTETERPLSAWVRGVNAHLHPSIRVLWAHEVNVEFHARFSARGRHYQFVLYNSPVASAVMAEKASWFHLPLDVEKMADGAKFLEGEHDFSAFRAAECQAKSPVRTLYEATVKNTGTISSLIFQVMPFCIIRCVTWWVRLFMLARVALSPIIFKRSCSNGIEQFRHPHFHLMAFI